MTTRLQALCQQGGQSPWIDNLRRRWLVDGHLAALVAEGVRGVTANPTILAKAIESGDEYDEQFASLVAHEDVETAYWDLVVTDTTDALGVLAPVHTESGGVDGFVSLEVAPALAYDTAGTVASARQLHDRIDRPNLYVKVPATAEGVPAIRALVGEGRSINVTLIFGLERYAEVMEAYVGGLEDHLASGADDLSRVSSVASFFVSRVDTEVDKRLAVIGSDDERSDVLALRGTAAVAQAQSAYRRFTEVFAGPRWEALAAKGARVQRPLWASTSTKNPAYPDLLYVDSLIGPDTVNTMPDATLDAFLDHGTVARTVDADPDGAAQALAALAGVGIDMEDVAQTLEDEGVAAFAKSYDDLLELLGQKASALPSTRSA